MLYVNYISIKLGEKQTFMAPHDPQDMAQISQPLPTHTK